MKMTAENNWLLPLLLALSLLAVLLVFLFEICAVLLTIASVILAVLGMSLSFSRRRRIGGIRISVSCLPSFAVWTCKRRRAPFFGALDGGKSALCRFLVS